MCLRLTLAILLTCGCAGASDVARADSLAPDRALLDSLDRELRNAPKYVEMRHRRIRLLRDMRDGMDASPEQEYQLNGKLYDEYFAFKFDSALYFLTRNLHLADTLGDRNLRSESLVELALLYTTSGMYLEAREVLTRQINTLAMNRDQRIHYYLVQQRFQRDFHEYSKHSHMAEAATRKLDYYRGRLFEELDPASEEYLSLRVTEAMHNATAWNGPTRSTVCCWLAMRPTATLMPCMPMIRC